MGIWKENQRKYPKGLNKLERSGTDGLGMKTDRPTIPLKGSKSLRTGRRSIPGQIYLLTTATFNREPFRQNPEAAAIVLNSFK